MTLTEQIADAIRPAETGIHTADVLAVLRAASPDDFMALRDDAEQCGWLWLDESGKNGSLISYESSLPFGAARRVPVFRFVGGDGPTT